MQQHPHSNYACAVYINYLLKVNTITIIVVILVNAAANSTTSTVTFNYIIITYINQINSSMVSNGTLFFYIVHN